MRRRLFTALLALLFGAGVALAAREHMLRMSGRRTLEGIKGCPSCHWDSIANARWKKAPASHASPAGLAMTRDGKRLYVTLDERDQLIEIDPQERRIVRTAHVRGAPTGIALSRDGDRLFVACKSGNRVAVVDLDRLEEIDSLPVGWAPVSLASVPMENGERVVVCNSASDDLSVLAAEPLAELGRLTGGREPYRVVAGDDGMAYVANRLASVSGADDPPVSELTVVDPRTVRVRVRAPLPSAHLSEGIDVDGGGRRAFASFIRVRNLVPITQVADGWVMSSGLALYDLKSSRVLELPLDEANAYFADPSGVAVDELRHRAFIASGGGDVVTVVDLSRLDRWLEKAKESELGEAIDDLQLSGEYVIDRIPTGRNPRELLLSSDGRWLVVAERLAESLLLIDAETLRPLGRIALGDGSAADEERRGESVFTRAKTTFQSGFSCRSCHPDGHVDGLTYDFDIDGMGRDILDNRSLQGLSRTAPFKWNGKNPSLGVQCGPRFAKVLTRADPIAGRDLTDLDAYLESLPPPRIPEAPLTPAQERGKALFFATKTTGGRDIPRSLRCSTCHRPPFYTDRLLADVGSKGERDSTSLFDTPHLLGIAFSAPYLHDGRARTLEEIWTIYNPSDRHGISSDMSKQQLNDLIEYLRTL